jgi:hypothetical protein
MVLHFALAATISALVFSACIAVGSLHASNFCSLAVPDRVGDVCPRWQASDNLLAVFGVRSVYPAFVIRAFVCRLRPDVLQLRHMSKTVTIRLTKELATWLEQASKQSGVPKGRIVREQLEKARDGGKEPSFMRLAGSVSGVRDLSTRKGFSRS